MLSQAVSTPLHKIQLSLTFLGNLWTQNRPWTNHWEPLLICILNILPRLYGWIMACCLLSPALSYRESCMFVPSKYLPSVLSQLIT